MGLYVIAIVVCLLLVRRYRRTAFILFTSITLLLLLLSTKLVGQWLFQRWEMMYPPVAMANVAEADYIVLLGGGIGAPESPRQALEFRFMGDRILHAARLFKSGKAPKVIVSGGNAVEDEGILSEAAYSSELLIELGVSSEAIILEQRSTNTKENVVYVAELLDDAESAHILLVTSALHMPRAYALFSRAEFGEVTAASTDIHVPDRKGKLWTRLIPSSTGLALSTNALHEMLGTLVNKAFQANPTHRCGSVVMPMLLTSVHYMT